MLKRFFSTTLQKNISLFYLTEFFYNIYFTLTIWVTFQRRYLSFTEMGLLASAGVLAMLIFQMPTGAFADIFGRKLSCIIGTFIRFVGYTLVAFSANKEIMIVGFLIIPIGDAFVSGANISLLYETLIEYNAEKRFANIRSDTVILSQVSVIIGMLVGGLAYEYWIGLPYLLAGLSYLVAMIIYSFYKETPIVRVKFTYRAYINKIVSGFREIFKNSHIRELSLGYVLIGAITFSFQANFNQIIATGLGFSEMEKSWLFSIIRFFNAFILLKLLHFDNLFKRHNFFVYFTLLIILFTLPGFVDNQILGVILMIGTTALSSTRFIVLDKLLNAELKKETRASALSALGLLLGVMYLILIAIMGPVPDFLFAGWMATIVGLLTLVLVLPLALYYQRKNKVIYQQID